MKNKKLTEKVNEVMRTTLQEHPEMVLRDNDALNKAQEKELSHLPWDSPWLKWELWNGEIITNGKPLKDNCYTHVYRRYPYMEASKQNMKCFIGVNHIQGNEYFTNYLFIPAETPYGPLESCEYEVWKGTDEDTGWNGEWTEFIGSELCDSGKLTKEDMNNRFDFLVFHGPLECRICTGLLIEAKKS